MTPMEYLGAWGTLIHEKNLKSKISCQTPFKDKQKLPTQYLKESCENRNRARGVGGGLLLLAACTDGPLLLVQQARKSMSQPAECAGIDPRTSEEIHCFSRFRKSGIYSNHLPPPPPPPWVYRAHKFRDLKLLG
jgi:hypothetical protein